MLFQWLVGIVAILALVLVGISDFWAGKSKHSTYYQKVQKPSGKEQRSANIPDPSTHDSFYTKLNTR
jgi:FtsZ-interacting cell division protein ZipA